MLTRNHALSYEAALKYYTYTGSLSGDEKVKVESANNACHLNIAASYLKLKNYKGAVEQCGKVLEKDQTNAKVRHAFNKP